MQTGYQLVAEMARKATSRFREVQEDYRSRKIGDAEYLAARAEYEKSVVAFDKAYAREAAHEV